MRLKQDNTGESICKNNSHRYWEFLILNNFSSHVTRGRYKYTCFKSKTLKSSLLKTPQTRDSYLEVQERNMQLRSKTTKFHMGNLKDQECLVDFFHIEFRRQLAL